MVFPRRFGLFHLACLRVFAPRSVLVQSMRQQRNIAAPWPQATPPQASKLLKRRFDFAGCNVEMPARILWHVTYANDAWHREFFGFRWIHELAVTNNQKAASSYIREFVNGFILHEREAYGVAQDPDVVGARLALWLQYRAFMLKGSSRSFRKRLGRSVIRHALSLSRSCAHENNNKSGFFAVLGLMSACVLISDMRFLMPIAQKRLRELLATEILPDGCHASLSPEGHMDVLRVLIDIRFLLTADSDLYHEVVKTITAMGRVLTFFCHGDGRLCLFNDSLMGDAGMISAVRQLASASDKYDDWLPDGGFLRLEQQRTRVIMAVTTQDIARGELWSESRLAFELSEGSERIIVNCGAYRGSDANWQKACVLPHVYSGLMFEPTQNQAMQLLTHEPILSTESNVGEGEDISKDKAVRGNIKCHAGTSGLFAEASHAYQVENIVFSHRRHLHLSRKGDVLSGRDIIVIQGEELPELAPVIRFHLHPDIRCHRMKGGVVELKSVSGKGWHFSATSGVELSVSESVYLGYYGKPQKTLQIVLRPLLKHDKTMISWQFKRINVATTVDQAQAVLLSETI